MRNLKTMTKILILVATMLLLLGIVSFMGYRTSANITGAASNMYTNYAQPAMWMLDSKANAIQIRRLIGRTLGMDAQEIGQVESIVATNRKAIDDYFSRYQSTNLTAEETSAFGNLTRIRAEAARKQDEILAAAKNHDPSRIEQMIERMTVQGDITVSENEYIAAFDALAQMLVRMANDVNAGAKAAADSAAMTIIIVSLVSALIGVVLAILISRRITKPLLDTQKSIESFAKGDLTSSFDTHGQDEVAVIAQNLQGMSESLNNVIGQVMNASLNISETSHEFSAMAEETNASVEEFRANVDEMGSNLDSLASASEEVNASVQEVAAGAQATAEKGTDIARKVDEAMVAGDEGVEAVRKAVRGISGVAESSGAATTAILELGNRARQIQSFVSQIGGIADQTNLLALNAAIEAARAGEAGRGFAVVAEEVRKLAEDSNIAAKNIAELASTITTELDTIVGFAQENAQDSNEAKNLSSDTETAINKMIVFLREIAGATQDLAAVSQEQAASSEEIAETIQNMATRIGRTAEAGENIRTSVTEVAAAAERVATGAEGLSTLASDLQSELEFFKIDDKSAARSGRLALKAR